MSLVLLGFFDWLVGWMVDWMAGWLVSILMQSSHIRNKYMFEFSYFIFDLVCDFFTFLNGLSGEIM